MSVLKFIAFVVVGIIAFKIALTIVSATLALAFKLAVLGAILALGYYAFRQITGRRSIGARNSTFLP